MTSLAMFPTIGAYAAMLMCAPDPGVLAPTFKAVTYIRSLTGR
jgi:hypothetical protein